MFAKVLVEAEQLVGVAAFGLGVKLFQTSLHA
ncbi:hypothetical protein Barb7_02063 [Bacteroidales bacterium Barb7]|nr:hypothetical protein Barb7_02063 [Bacteroidales bacterium Barb7]